MATIDFVVKNGLTVTEKTTIQSTTDTSSSSDTNASLNTAGGSAIAKKLYVGTDFQAGGTTINLGTSAAALTTTTLGGAITGNILKVSSTAAGTINLSTDVTTGIINAFTSLTTGTMNIGTGSGAGTFNIGGPAAVLNIGTTGGDSIIELRANSSTGTATLRTSAGVTTANVFNTVSTTGNLFGAATTISVGTTSGTITLSNPTVVGTQAIVNLWNTTSTTVNAFGAATTIGIGAATGTLTLGNITITGTNAATFNMNGTNPSIASSNIGTASLFNANITAINFGQAAAISMGATTLNTTVRGHFLVNGNTTLGDASGDTVTYKANTSYVPNTYTFTLDDAVINNTSYPIKFSHTTSGTAAVGIGTGVQFITENADGTGIAGSYIESVSTNVTAGAEAFNLVFKTMTAGGTAAQAMSVNNNTLTVGAGSTSTTITTQTSSNLTILPGATGVTSNGTSLTLKAGPGGATSGNGGAATIGAGDASTLGVGGIATFRSGISVGTNQVGVSTIIEAGNGTGTGGSGDIVFRTAQAGVSGATANTMADRFYIRPSGAIDIVGTMTVSGDLIVNGTTTTVNSTIVSVDDKNIELGSVVAKSGLQATLTLVTAIVNLTTGDTKSLIPGMLLTVNTGPGAFGAAALILTVNSLTQFTASINHSVAGNVTFTAGAATDFTADGGGITIKGDSDKTFTWVKTTNAFSANTKLSGTELISTVAVGTAPLTVTSTTVVTNLNADLLDGQNGSWYNDWTNITNKPDPVVTITLTGDVTGTGTATLTDLASGTASFATTIAADSVVLGTDTTGNYVASMTASTGITVGTATGEGSTPVITNTGVTSLVAGNAITISSATGAVTVNHADTSSQASVDNSNGTVIQDVTLDTYGHVTGLASVDLDLRYLGKTAKAADSELLDGYDSTAYQGPVSAVKTFYWAIPQSGNQAKQFEIARVAVDFNDWNSIGAIEIELLEKYYGSGLKKKYTISYGSGPTSTLRLVEYIGVGPNNFRVTVGASVTGTGDQRWIPIYVETVAYAQCDVRLTTNWNQTGTNPPPMGTMFIIGSPGAGTNISAFSPDSVPELTSASSATINGATILTSFAEADTLATVTGRGASTSTNITLSGGTLNLGHATANTVTTASSATTSSAITIRTGAGTASSSVSGGLTLGTGATNGTVTTGASSGNVRLETGISGTNGAAGSIILEAGLTKGSASNSGSISLYGGWSDNTTSSDNGHIYIKAGSATAATGTKSGGKVWIDGGRPAAGGTIVNDGTVNIGTIYGTAGDSGTTTVNIGSTSATTTITGTVKLPTVGTSGFVKLGAGGVLSADTSGYVEYSNYIAAQTNPVGNFNVGLTRPKGASYTTTASSVTGAIKIKTPPGVPMHGMWKMTVKIYEYGQRGNGYTIELGCHLYPSTAYNRYQWMLTTDSGGVLPIRYGTDGTSGCIWIGENATTWSYPQIHVTEFSNGFNNPGGVDWTTGTWSVTIGTIDNSVAVDGPYTTSLPAASTAGSETLATVTGRGATTTTVPSFNGGGRFLAPNDEFFSFTNVDSDSTHYTSRGNRLLTSNGTNWATDGKDAVIAITRSSAGTTRGQSIGLTLHNENSTTNAYSPAITFSARSESGNYNSMYAAIMGKKTGPAGGSGTDTNWNRGELHFYTVGGYYVGDVPTMVLVGTSTSTGGVGIGTTTVNSGYSLDIQNNQVLVRMESTTGAGSALFVIKNGAGSTIFGNQGSVASTFTGAYNYATVFGTDSARALQFATNNEVRFEANSAGTFSVYKNSFMVGETYGGLSIGESPTNYNGWDRQLNVHGTGNARIHVKTGTVSMGMYAHDTWQAVSGTTPGGFVGTYNSYPLSFLVNASQVGVFNTSGFFGVGTASPGFKLSVNTAADVWHAQFGTSGGKQLRIGGSTTNGSVIGAYNNDGNSSPASLLLNRDGGNVGIGTSAPVYTLQVVGSFAATTKSFVIDHPTKPGMKLRYGSLEGPENGVYVRGRLKGNTIELPEYWTKLVDPDSITVNLTPIGKHQNLYVLCIKDNVVHVENSGLFPSKIDCFYTVYGERVDVDKLVVEF